MLRLSARARLDDSAVTLAHARAEAAAGDESWEQWLSEYERGEALVLHLELAMSIAGGAQEIVRTVTGGFFVECNPHAPKVERQIAEVASGEFIELVGALAADGHGIDADELAEMYVHVDLDPEVLRRLTQNASPAV